MFFFFIARLESRHLPKPSTRTSKQRLADAGVRESRKVLNVEGINGQLTRRHIYVWEQGVALQTLEKKQKIQLLSTLCIPKLFHSGARELKRKLKFGASQR